MIKDLYTAALGMINQKTRLEVVSSNIANANTTGFKRESVFERNLIDARANLYNVPGDPEQDDPPIGSYVDFSAGSYKKTENPLDIAIEGNGFFNLQDEAGNTFLTRAGHFKISTEGMITAMDGKMLLSESGPVSVQGEILSEPLITGEKVENNLRITEQGEIFLNDYFVGSLQITEVNNPESLRKISGQNFLTSEMTELNNLSSDQVKIKQGWLEGSNVNIINEMVSMIELQRNFEAGSKVIQTSDATLDTSNRIGRFY